MSLKRFIDAQDDPAEGYAVALSEICSTGKRSHWMWYVFPQMSGLGESANARYYALSDPEEALSYLHHPLLGARLLEICEAVVLRLRGGSDLVTLMNSRVDVQKLVSCMTLFAGLAEHRRTHERLFGAASFILRAAEDRGFPICAYTSRRLAEFRPHA